MSILTRERKGDGRKKREREGRKREEEGEGRRERRKEESKEKEIEEEEGKVREEERRKKKKGTRERPSSVSALCFMGRSKQILHRYIGLATTDTSMSRPIRTGIGQYFHPWFGGFANRECMV